MIYEGKHRAEFEALMVSTFWKPINDQIFRGPDFANSMQFFDKEGFELTDLEHMYATVNLLPMTKKAFGHRAIGWHWIENDDVQHPDIFVDHSYIVYRPGFAGKAKEQIERHVKRYPYLNKLLAIKPKIGLDLALEYVTEKLTTEVLHLEFDFHDIDNAFLIMALVQQSVKNRNWYEAIDKIKETQSQWQDLLSDDQSDFKAKLLGFDRTYQTLKTV